MQLYVMKRDITLLINKSEITAGTRGASLGPEAIMTAARKTKDTLFSKYPKTYIKERNELLDLEVKFPFAKRIEGLVDVFENVSNAVASTLSDNVFPFVLAGDHGSAGGTIAGIKKAFPNKRLGVVWIDAHGDCHTPFTTPSGNMHGMPLATALSEDNKESGSNNVHPDAVKMWDTLKNTGVSGVKVLPEDIAFIAVRDTETPEDELMERLNIRNYTVEEVRSNGAEKIMETIYKQLDACDLIYVSFDVDSMDPLYTSHGTGTPVDNGLLPEEAEYFLTSLAAFSKVKCIEFVEVNPCLDEKKNKMAEVTYDLFKKTVAELEK